MARRASHVRSTASGGISIDKDIKQIVQLPTLPPLVVVISYPGQYFGYGKPLARRGVKLGVSLPSVTTDMNFTLKCVA